MLQFDEVEVTRDVCLQASDVLINGGSSSCSLGAGQPGANTLPWLLAALGLLLSRRKKRAL
jgi:MYXO-CTERM domain-containing protein